MYQSNNEQYNINQQYKNDNQYNKLTLELIADYIKQNLYHFTSDEEIIVVEQQPKKIKNIIKNENDNKIIQKKSFIQKLSNLTNNQNLRDFKDDKIINCLDNFDVLKTFTDENKIYSFYTCILSAFDNNFLKNSDEDKQKYIDCLVTYLKCDISQDGFRQHGYSKLKWTKNQILELLKKNDMSDKLIRYISDAFHINIFYIDFDDENKIKYTGDADFIVFKKILIMVKTKNQYYLMYNSLTGDKTFNFTNNDFIKFLLINQDYITLIFADKFNCVGRNFNSNIIDLPNDKCDKINNSNDSNIDELTIDESNIVESHIVELTIDDKTNVDDLTSINGFEEESITQKNIKKNIQSQKQIEKQPQKQIEKQPQKQIEKQPQIKKQIQNTINYTEDINEQLSLIELQKKAKEKNIDIFLYPNNIRRLKTKKELCKELLE
jgi:hypothetical protein